MTAEGESILEGTLDRIVFQNPTSQWTVARIARDKGGEVTAVGSLLGIPIGTPLILRGAWVDDPKFGRQFRIESYRTRSPETLLGIERYLGSGLIKGIGPELAKRIVGHFGMSTLEVIAETPKRLTEVDGIGGARALSVAHAYAEQKHIQDVMVFLRGHGVSSAFAARIFKKYGKDAIGLVRENPYRLALEIWGIGFKTADAIAQNLGLDRAAPARMEAGLVHALGELVDAGHTHAPEPQLVAAAAELLGVDADSVSPALDRLALSRLIVREELGDRGRCASLAAMWENEVEAARALARLVAKKTRKLDIDVAAALSQFESASGLSLAGEQRKAIEAAVTDKCVVITGGPGVGKTTIVRAIVRLHMSKLRRVSLAAPTGRAAKRLSESTGNPATTIHRMLEFNPRTGAFERNSTSPLEVDILILDEVSMVDTPLFRSLLVALPASAQLILVGDIDQLPSVGPGSVLRDVIRSGSATVVNLTQIFRQAAESAIVTNAHRVNRGEPPALTPPAGDDPTRSDFYFVDRDDPVAARDTVLELVADRIPNRFGFDSKMDIQVLAPMHRGEVGTVALNAALQEALNPLAAESQQIKRGNRVFRVGDKVMQIRNNYDKDVFNGDIGVIRETDGKSLAIELVDGRRVEYEAAELDELVHAFAISVHKSQGSEYPAVVIPLLTQHYMMLQRNLLYTGMTRGKRLVVLVGSKRAVFMAVKNDDTRTRWTWLSQRIRDFAALA